MVTGQWLRATVRRPDYDSYGSPGGNQSRTVYGRSVTTGCTPVIDRPVGSPRSSDRVTATPHPLPPCDRVTAGQPAATLVLPGAVARVPRRRGNQKGWGKQL